MSVCTYALKPTTFKQQHDFVLDSLRLLHSLAPQWDILVESMLTCGTAEQQQVSTQLTYAPHSLLHDASSAS